MRIQAPAVHPSHELAPVTSPTAPPQARSRSFGRPLSISGLALVLALPAAISGCAPPVLGIEVLPPRTSATCSAPNAASSALGRGLLDVEATESFHGAYIADIRLTSRADVLVDGLKLSFSLPDDAGSDAKDEAKDVSGAIALGDVLLLGSEDDVRKAVVENVQLLPRSLARALRNDGDLGLSEKEYATITVEMIPVDGEEEIGSDPSTFAIDVCKGCLVTRPADEDCEHGVSENSVCRQGQDVILYECAGPPSGSIF